MATYNTENPANGRRRVESPCIDHCALDDDDICVGCFRSIDEICAWSGAADEQRRMILQAAAGRRSRDGGRG